MEAGNMIRIFAVLFGIGFIFIGVAGFSSTFMSDGLLFKYFEVGTFHNIFHIVSGVLAIMAATSRHYTKWYFIILGLIYGLIAVWGFMWNGDFQVVRIHTNMADNMLYIIIAIIALYLGFSAKRFPAHTSRV
jgi:hypothetical protein